MVRPVARFRPGARRTGSEVIPVFAVTQEGSDLLQIWTGSGGYVGFINPFDDVARNLASVASVGLDVYVADYYTSFADPYIIVDQTETIDETYAVTMIREDVINGFYLVSYIRSHSVRIGADVYWREALFGVPTGSVQRSSVGATFRAVYDYATFAIDLETGEKHASANVVYRFSAEPLDWLPPNNFNPNSGLHWAGESVVNSAPVTFQQSLPAFHPFKACNFAVFGFAPPGAESESYNAWGSPSFDVVPAGVFADAIRTSANCKGLNTISLKRALFRQNVLEISEYALSPTSTSCDLYEELNLVWNGSSALYSPSAVLDRADLFADLDGMNQQDQDLFLYTTLLPPSAFGISGNTAAVVQAAQYAMEADVMLENFGRFAFDYAKRRSLLYWLTD